MNYSGRVNIPFNNYSYHAASDLQWLEGEVVKHTNLVAALAFAKRVTGASVIPTVITQDEYTHDVVMRVGDELYLAYGMT